MDSAAPAVELLAGDHTNEELAEIAEEIAETNRRRKSVQEETAKMCRTALDRGDCGDYAPVIFVPDAHEGVAGIVAGSLKEELNKQKCKI